MLNGHGDDIFKYKDIRINFSSNVYNHFDHEGLFSYLADRLDYVVNYPEPSPSTLEAELAMMLGIKADELMVTNGATEAIYLIAQTFRDSTSTIMTPTFAEYADACRLHGHDISRGGDMCWLCNPNNPTGTVTPKDELIAKIESHPDVTFVIDASYAPFTRQPLLSASEAAAYPNVLMLHSMTKEFAIPGLRLGYLTGCTTLLEPIRRQRMPWSVNQVAIDAGHYLIRHSDEFWFDLDALLNERKRVEEELKKLGVIEVWPSDTHILLCRLRFGNAAALKDYLASEHGILIRDASNFEGLDRSFFRIAVQTKEENDELIERIAQWMEE
ncbi:MAG: pyridoxal phosphate-dependent class II aminotransferase [Bacteroidales bacterium]|nr:pyridoxal phosphate-dependent class II aminotransferase [Bacteroidales bacterium]